MNVAADSGRANLPLQGTATPGVHAEGAARGPPAVRRARPTDAILSPTTLIASHGARRAENSPATGNTLIFPQQDRTRSLTVVDATVEEDDSEIILEEKSGEPRWAGTNLHAQPAQAGSIHLSGPGYPLEIVRGPYVPGRGTYPAFGHRGFSF